MMTFEVPAISIVLRKEVEDTGDNDYENHPYEPQELKYITGFRVGGGIDQDPKKCPYGFTDSGIYVTFVYPQSPAEDCGLMVNDKILQVNGYDMSVLTHAKAVEVIRRHEVLNMLVYRPSAAGRSHSSGTASPRPIAPRPNGLGSPPSSQSYQAVPATNYAPNPYPRREFT